MPDNVLPLIVLEKIPEGTPPPMQHYRPPPKLLVAKKHKTHQAIQLMMDALAPFQPEKVHPQGTYFTAHITFKQRKLSYAMMLSGTMATIWISMLKGRFPESTIPALGHILHGLTAMIEADPVYYIDRNRQLVRRTSLYVGRIGSRAHKRYAQHVRTRLEEDLADCCMNFDAVVAAMNGTLSEDWKKMINQTWAEAWC
jgi:hypothetical protein